MYGNVYVHTYSYVRIIKPRMQLRRPMVNWKIVLAEIPGTEK